MCEQLHNLLTKMKYLASRRLWNLQPLKVPDTNSWVVPSTRFKSRNRDFRCTIHRNKPRLQHINSIQIHTKIERFVFKFEDSWKPPQDNHLAYRICTQISYNTPLYQTHCKKLCESELGDGAPFKVEEFPLFGKLRTWRQFSQLHFFAMEIFL